MVIMCGLLSVGWHLRHRETHLKWLDEINSNTTETREKWYKMLLKSFDDWKYSFDAAVRSSDGEMGSSAQSGSTGLIQNAHSDLVTDASYDFYGLRLATCSLDQRFYFPDYKRKAFQFASFQNQSLAIRRRKRHMEG